MQDDAPLCQVQGHLKDDSADQNWRGKHGVVLETETHEGSKWESFEAKAHTLVPLAMEVSGLCFGNMISEQGREGGRSSCQCRESQHPGQQALWQAAGPGDGPGEQPRLESEETP